jgi:hypothetical protein
VADETDAAAPSATPDPAAESPDATPEASAEETTDATPEASAEETTDATPEPAVHVVASHAAGPRRSFWKPVLAVIGIVIVVIGAALGGVLYGRASAPGPDIIVTSEPVVEESAAVEPMPVGTLPMPESSAAGEANQSDPSGTLVVPPAILSAAPGLPDTATLASGYRLVNAGISGAQVAGVLAAALGAPGLPVEEDGSWVVGAPGGPMLTVIDDPLFTWTFEDTGVLASPAIGEQLEPATAIELTSALLGSIGVDVASVDWQVDRYFGRTAVTAWQLVSGQRTELGWQVALDPSGAVVQASGFSAGLEEVPGYPVLGAASAIARSSSQPWSLVGASPARVPEVAPSPSASPLTPLARPGISVPVSEVTVTEATLGLAQYWQPDGGMLMLPSYVLSGDDGSRWSLLAVEEPYVQFVDQPYPTADPAAG